MSFRPKLKWTGRSHVPGWRSNMLANLQAALLELLDTADHSQGPEGLSLVNRATLQTIRPMLVEIFSEGTLDAFVTVSGGVAYVAKTSPDVKVHLIDYDNLESDFGATF